MKQKNLFSVMIMFISTFGVGLLSYAYHPIMLQYLTLSQFGEFESLLSIINLITVVTLALSLFLVKEFSKDISGDKTSAIMYIAGKYLSALGIILFLVYVLFSPFINSFLKINNINIVILTGGMILFTFLGLYQSAFLQGKKEFSAISYTNIINPLAKLIIGWLLVILGFQVFGAILGTILGVFVYLVIRYFIVKSKSKKYISKNINQKKLEQEILADFISQKKQIGQFFLSSILLALLMNIDILFAKHFFEPEIAGTYAGISIIAKFLVFIGMSIETVYYPVLTAEKTIDKKKVFLLSSLYGIITLGALGFFYLFGEKILYIFKPGFEKYLDLLYLIIIYCGGLALLNFIVKILTAFNKYILNYILIGILILCIVLLYMFTGDSMYNLIHVFNGIMFLSITLAFSYLGLVKNEK